MEIKQMQRDEEIAAKPPLTAQIPEPVKRPDDSLLVRIVGWLVYSILMGLIGLPLLWLAGWQWWLMWTLAAGHFSAQLNAIKNRMP